MLPHRCIGLAACLGAAAICSAQHFTAHVWGLPKEGTSKIFFFWSAFSRQGNYALANWDIDGTIHTYLYDSSRIDAPIDLSGAGGPAGLASTLQYVSVNDKGAVLAVQSTTSGTNSYIYRYYDGHSLTPLSPPSPFSLSPFVARPAINNHENVAINGFIDAAQDTPRVLVTDGGLWRYLASPLPDRNICDLDDAGRATLASDAIDYFNYFRGGSSSLYALDATYYEISNSPSYFINPLFLNDNQEVVGSYYPINQRPTRIATWSPTKGYHLLKRLNTENYNLEVEGIDNMGEVLAYEDQYLADIVLWDVNNNPHSALSYVPSNLPTDQYFEMDRLDVNGDIFGYYGQNGVYYPYIMLRTDGS